MPFEDANTYSRACILISRIYQVPEGERDQFVERECGSDEELRKEVKWMIEALGSPQKTTFLDGSPMPSALIAEDTIQVPAPRDYRIIRMLGEGGMGMVYLAQRTDGEFEQQVALKLLNLSGLLQPAVLSRFISERQILAELNHPNIAHLVDGGTLPDGRPFLAMEYVDGIRIDHYCESADLNINQRLALFLKVCAAVQFAHQHLIVHRDIKPENILVDRSGEPKLLDFGIARLLDESGPGLSPKTSTGMRMMTLAYASPEQIAGKTVSVSTDVFSLGVVLYELLTRHRPWPQSDSVVALAKSISEWDPPAPSAGLRDALDARTSKIKLGIRERRIAADLDAIVLKALRKEPAQRYATVQDLADDIANYRESRPVSARRGRAWYRASKFIIRHRFASLWVTGLLVLVTAFVADRQIQLERTRVERTKAEQINDFLLDLFSASKPDIARGKELSAKELLQRGSERLQHSLAEQPVARSAMLYAIASVFNRLGLFNEARPLFEQALEVRQAAPGAADPVALATYHLGLSTLELNLSHPQAAKERAETAMRILDGAGMRNNRSYAIALADWATASRTLGTPAAELTAKYDQALSILDKTETHPLDKERIQIRYSLLLRTAGRQAEALAIANRALQSLRARNDPTEPLILSAERTVASFYISTGDFQKAEVLIRETLTEDRRIFGSQHPMVADELISLGNVLVNEENYADAETAMREALSIVRADKANASADTEIRILNNLAVALKMQKKYTEASGLQDEILSKAADHFGKESEMYAGALEEKASIALHQKDYAAAERLFHQSIEITTGLLPDRWEDLADLNADLGVTYLAMNEPAKAQVVLASAADSREKHLGRENISTLHVLPDLAAALAAQGNVDAANKLFVESFAPIAAKDGECAEFTVRALKRWHAAADKSPAISRPPEKWAACTNAEDF